MGCVDLDLLGYFLTQPHRSMLRAMHYFPIYERHFRRFVGNPITMFEIGSGQGGSAQMWKHYFGPLARIVTIDIADKAYLTEPQIHPRRGDQGDPAFLNALVDEFGPPDIVLDDGSHLMKHINASFDVLFPRMSPAGTYLVEDLDGAYWADHGGGLRHPDSFIERAKALVDEMHADYTSGALKAGPYGRGLVNIAFYHALVVLEKSPSINREMIQRPLPVPAP